MCAHIHKQRPMANNTMTHSLSHITNSNSIQQQQQLKVTHENGSIVIPGDCLGPIRVTAASPAVSKPSESATTTQFTTNVYGPLHDVQYISGEGTYSRNGFLYASIVGRVNISSITIPLPEAKKASDVQQPSTQSKRHVLTVQTVSIVPKDGCFRAIKQVMREGQVVLGRVVRVGTVQQQVYVDIIANPYGMLDAIASGTIRRDDVTKIIPTLTTQSLSIDNGTSSSQPSLPLLYLTELFRPGDWIVAKVLSLGDDQQRYYLSTAESSLGVIYATCATNNSNQMMIPISNKEMECPITGTIETRKCARPPIKVN